MRRRRRVALLTALASVFATSAALPAPAASRGDAGGVRCPVQYRPWVTSLTVLDGSLDIGSLDIGISYGKYMTYLMKTLIAYHQLPTNRASSACVLNVGVPAENAMNNYVLASNSWGACIDRIYARTASTCSGTGAPGNGSRRIFWTRAHKALERAVNNLG